ncbi:MAG: efflux RND transporter periplasmic adaptor subunit, partial [Candidatus Moranbacteria bacterium CG_4_9_14_0_8_um_filter_41_43]
QSVTLGKNTGGKTEVLSGISTHDHIVIEGEHTLVDNQLVKEIYDAK